LEENREKIAGLGRLGIARGGRGGGWGKKGVEEKYENLERGVDERQMGSGRMV